MGAMLSWLFSVQLQRLQNLKMALSEVEIGWIPYFLERAEHVYDKQRHWMNKGVEFVGHAKSVLDNEEYDLRVLYHEHVFGCVIDDVHGLNNRDIIGEDNVMIKHAQEGLAHSPPDTQLKVLRGNAERVHRFEAAGAGVSCRRQGADSDITGSEGRPVPLARIAPAHG